MYIIWNIGLSYKEFVSLTSCIVLVSYLYCSCIVYLVLFSFGEYCIFFIPRPLMGASTSGGETILAVKVSTGIAGYLYCEEHNKGTFICIYANFFVPLQPQTHKRIRI